MIAIVSGKGGTGKTSLCAGIAQALAESGERVLCIDCDVGMRNLDIALGLSQMGALSFQEALDYGLIAEVYEDVDTLRVKAEELAKELAAKAPITMKIDKRLIYDAVGKQPTDIAQRDALALGFVFTTHDAIEGLNAFLEKRPAKYEGR